MIAKKINYSVSNINITFVIFEFGILLPQPIKRIHFTVECQIFKLF